MTAISADRSERGLPEAAEDGDDLSLLRSAGCPLVRRPGLQQDRGCTPGDRLAALDPATGATNPNFHPQPNASVLKLALYGRTLYLGGKFTVVAGVARLRLAAVDAITGGLAPGSSWRPTRPCDLALNSTGSTAWNPNIHASG
jgi:hypothetical protein